MRPDTRLKGRIAACAMPSTEIAKFHNVAARKNETLTDAENRVLALVVRAKTNKEIAGALGISPATVKRHLENILRKLGVRNRVEAAICGLFLNGCSAGFSSICPLQAWIEARDAVGPTWAE